MTNAGVRELIILLEAAYRADTEHSILGSLWNVGDTEWAAKPTDDGRSVRDIVRHVATGYHAYYNAGFGKGPSSWDHWSAVCAEKADREDLVAWMEEGHNALATVVAGLADSELESPRGTHWGGIIPTRGILLTVIAHAFYHSGEINHLRSVLQGNDRWGHYVNEMPAPGG
jgi:uncharacterized damage-inducible protein DinB